MCINLCTSDEEDEDEKDEVNRPKFRRKRIHSVNSSVDGQLTKPQGLLYCESRSNPLIQDSHDIVRTHQSSGVIAETAEGLVESNDIVEVVPSNNIIIERVVTSEKLPLLNETEIRYVGNEKFDEKQNEKFMLHVLHEESLVTKSDQFVTENIDNANFLVEDQSITNESFKSDVTPVSDIKSLKGLNFEEIKDKNVTLEEFFVAQQSSDVKCGLNRCGSDSDIFTILGHSSDATQPRNPNASKYKSRNELGNERSQRREKRKLSHGGQPPKSNLSPLKKVKSSRMPSGEKDDSFSAKTCEVLSSPEHLGTPIIKMIADDHGKSAEKSQLSEMSQFQYKDNDKHSEGSKQGGIKLQSDISSSDKQNPIYVYDRLKNRCGNLLPSSIKSIRITDPRPLTIRRGSTCDPIQVSQPVALPKKSCQPPMVIAPKRVGGRRKSAKDSLKAKMKHKMGHRIPIPGGGSDVRINPTSPTKHCTSTFSK